MTGSCLAEGWLTFGHDQGLRFQLQWNPQAAPGPGYEAETWGHLLLWVKETLIWGEKTAPKNTPITWDWIDLLRFLTDAWPYLCLEEEYPSLIASGYEKEIIHPGLLRSTTKGLWAQAPQEEEKIDLEDEILRDFELTHDLAHGVRGGLLPSLTLLRQGNTMLAANKTTCWRLDLNETLNTLTQMGDGIAARLRQVDDKTVKGLVSRWQDRNKISTGDYLAIAANVDPATSVTDFWPQAFDAVNVRNCTETYPEDGMLMAARMVGSAVEPEQKKHILRLISSVKAVDRHQLTSLSALHDTIKEVGLLESALVEDPSTYQKQGYRLAQWLRKNQKMTLSDERIEPLCFLEEWGIEVAHFNSKAMIDAVAVWGERQHPTIFLNQNGPRVRDDGGRRFTLAHEAGHLLMDGDRERTTVGDVLGPAARNSSRRSTVERRANAFAAELLLPEEKVRTRLLQENIPDNPKALEAFIQTLSTQFGASKELVAWKIEHTRLIPKERLDPYKNSLNTPYDP